MSDLEEVKKIYNPPEDKITDDGAIEFSQLVRKDIVNKLMAEGALDDNNSINTVLRALEGMSSTALSNKRMKTDKEISSEQSKAKTILGEVYKLMGNKNPYESEVATNRQLDIPDQLCSDFKQVPGETDIGVSVENFDSFAKKHGIKT